MEKVTKYEKNCHNCGDKLEGILAEFTHCPKCNKIRIVEGFDDSYDPCHVCMNLKTKEEKVW